ncbi:MAG: PAS domain S-box protein [Ferruginibacter sp.]|nr:PAS domain S-box protein [Ferruginibacter sp.]
MKKSTISKNAINDTGITHDINYRSILSQSPNAIFISNSLGKLIMVNKGMMKLTGFTKNKLLKLNLSQLFPGVNNKERKFDIKKKNKSKSFLLEESLRIKGDKLIDVQMNASFLSNGDMLVFLKNITENKKYRQLLLENEQRLLRAEKIGNMGQGFYNLQSKTLNISDGLYRIFGVKAHTFSHTINGIRNLIHHDDLKMMDKLIHNLKTKGKKEVELRIIQPSGMIRNVLFKTEITKDNNGILQNIFATAIDITEQKNANAEKQLLLQRYEQTINTALAGFILSDAKGNILQVNPGYLKLTGYSKAALLKKNLYSIEINSGKKHKAYSNKPVRYETKHRKKNNDIIEVEVSQSIMQGIDGPLKASFIYDITQKKKVQRQIENHNKKLQQLTHHLQRIREEERRRIGREIHDELGQQLTAIKMDVAWIDKKIPGEEVILKQKISNIITLLDGSNVSVRRILHELKPSILDEYGLHDAIEHLVLQFTSNTGIPVNHSLCKNYTGLSKDAITCLYRITQESLTNIAKYAKAKSVFLTIKKGRKNVTALIEDDGIGFDLLVLENNDSFGLMGIQERVSVLEGIFNIKSIIGKGTTIKVVLPLMK